MFCSAIDKPAPQTLFSLCLSLSLSPVGFPRTARDAKVSFGAMRERERERERERFIRNNLHNGVVSGAMLGDYFPSSAVGGLI